MPRADSLDGSGGAMAGSGLAAPAPILAASDLHGLRTRAALRDVYHAGCAATSSRRRAGGGRGPGRPRPGDVPGPPVSAGLPGHVDPPHVRGGAHLASPAQPQRAEPPTAAARHAGPRRRVGRPALRRSLRAGDRGRAGVGRDRGDGRAAAHPRRVRRGARGGDHAQSASPIGASFVASGSPASPCSRRQKATASRRRSSSSAQAASRCGIR